MEFHRALFLGHCFLHNIGVRKHTGKCRTDRYAEDTVMSSYTIHGKRTSSATSVE